VQVLLSSTKYFLLEDTWRHGSCKVQNTRHSADVIEDFLKYCCTLNLNCPSVYRRKHTLHAGNADRYARLVLEYQLPHENLYLLYNCTVKSFSARRLENRLKRSLVLPCYHGTLEYYLNTKNLITVVLMYLQIHIINIY
jgi:hypothetical protein